MGALAMIPEATPNKEGEVKAVFLQEKHLTTTQPRLGSSSTEDQGCPMPGANLPTRQHLARQAKLARGVRPGSLRDGTPDIAKVVARCDAILGYPPVGVLVSTLASFGAGQEALQVARDIRNQRPLASAQASSPNSPAALLKTKLGQSLAKHAAGDVRWTSHSESHTAWDLYSNSSGAGLSAMQSLRNSNSSGTSLLATQSLRSPSAGRDRTTLRKPTWTAHH
eukprot:TRINITY_DN77133_c0_g1_i1.p1 TRINITY_DN77133_c0_g1~~TRINITY_DN77133_c0_g1_i1.p1  ORF type:complete len:257 (-),score=30.87 TRINITY_DN77133_c0_g1_i1:341-1009(-)